jgi:putative serine protease PepD
MYAGDRPIPPRGGAGTPQASSPPGRRRLATVLAVVAVLVLAAAAGFGGGWWGGSVAERNAASSDTSLTQRTNGQPTADAAGSGGSVQSVADAVLPSVVSVVAVSQNAGDEGSGVILTSSGLILTNNHVIEGAQRLTVQFNDGTTAAATVVGTDATDDLAVIKVSGISGLKPATLGTSGSVQVGQQVVAVGSPLGLSATVTSGIVSALNRPVRTSGDSRNTGGLDTVLNAIQTDAAINPGNSGGPLVDMSGYVIGINSAIASLSTGSSGQSGSIGVGFAIPIDQAHRIAQEIINTGKASHAVLGATVYDAVNRDDGITTGAAVKSVTSDGGADKAGIKAGDVITKVDDTPVESADALVATIRSSVPGGKIQVTYTRDRKSSTVTVTLGSATD